MGLSGLLVRAGFPGRCEWAQLCGGDARLIFEGWVPHDPVFVAVRGLVAGAATGLVVTHSRFADCSLATSLRPVVLARAPATPERVDVVGIS